MGSYIHLKGTRSVAGGPLTPNLPRQRSQVFFPRSAVSHQHSFFIKGSRKDTN